MLSRHWLNVPLLNAYLRAAKKRLETNDQQKKYSCKSDADAICTGNDRRQQQ